MRIAFVHAAAAIALGALSLASAKADAASDYKAYSRAVRAAITQSLFGPAAPGWIINRTGRAVVHFRLDRAGRIVKMRVGKSSGDLEFESVAMWMVRRAAGSFPAMPASAPGGGAEFAIPIDASILYK